MYRLFVALELPPNVKQALSRLCFGLPGAKWMSQDQMHLNLRFIGEVDGGVLRDVQESLQSVSAEPFELELNGVGFFPPRRKPELLWVGVKKNDALKQLRHKVENAIVRTGVKPEGRKFAPHVTLARLKDTPPHRVAEFLTGYGLLSVPPFAIDHFCLYSSFLASEGAIHTVEATYELQSKRSLLNEEPS